MEEQSKVVLAIGAHASDIELGCAGTLIRLKEGGFKIYGLILTDPDGRITQDRSKKAEHTATGREEAKRSARFLNFDEYLDHELFDEVLFFAGLQDSTVEHGVKTIDRILEVVNRINPVIVFTHSEHDIHSDHIHTALSTVSAVRKRTVILKYESYFAGPRFTPKVYADITESFAKKIVALKYFETQIPEPIDFDKVKELTAERGKEVGVEYAECFEIEAFKPYIDILSILPRVFVRYPEGGKPMEIPEVKRPSREILSRVHALEREKGMIAAIEPETGEWFLGKNVIEALRNARSKYPEGIFYFVRVGYPSAHTHKGVGKRV